MPWKWIAPECVFTHPTTRQKIYRVYDGDWLSEPCLHHFSTSDQGEDESGYDFDVRDLDVPPDVRADGSAAIFIYAIRNKLIEFPEEE